jgi:hypothetical protein
LEATSVSFALAMLGVWEMSWNTTNAGQTVDGLHSWEDTCSLVNGIDVSSIDVPLGTFAVTLPLVAGQSWSTMRRITIPTGIPSGSYYVRCAVDSGNTIAEDGGENNNVAYTSSAVQISTARDEPSVLPDLVVRLGVNAVVVRPGWISATFSVVNIGRDSTVAHAWFDAIFIEFVGSPETSTSPTQLFPSLAHSSRLEAFGNYSVVNMTVAIPRPFAGRAVHVYVMTDVGQIVSDTNRSNNAVRLTATPITLQHAPTRVVSLRPELASNPVENGTTADPVPVIQGWTTVFRLCMNNSGTTHALGPWYGAFPASLRRLLCSQLTILLWFRRVWANSRLFGAGTTRL